MHRAQGVEIHQSCKGLKSGTFSSPSLYAWIRQQFVGEDGGSFLRTERSRTTVCPADQRDCEARSHSLFCRWLARVGVGGFFMRWLTTLKLCL